MKKRSFIAIVALFVLVLSSCREITVKTIINEDGSFTRYIIVNGEDTAAVYKADLPYPVDASWETEFKVDSSNSNKPYTLTYTKHFNEGEDLYQSLESDTGWSKSLDRDIKIDKRLGLFYSYLEFQETIKAANPFTYLDYKDYLSMDDILMLKGAVLLTNNADSAQLSKAEEKADEFLLESFTAEILYTLKQGIKSSNNPSLQLSDVDFYTDSIKQKVESMDDENTDVFVDYLAGWTCNTDYLELKKQSPDLFAKSDERVKLFYQILFMEEYSQKVEMPGLLTETNSIAVVGNQVSWKVYPIAFMFEDYTMYAESRVVNYWAFIISGIILMLLVIFLIVKTLRS